MAEYEGARFWKCDLQVQTPEDHRRWEGEGALQHPRTENDLQEQARRFLRRCHEVELEVIAVTDHNLSSYDGERDLFLTHLLQQNRSVAEDVGRRALVVFPGFELDIGFHILCLFEPGTRVGEISGCLTSLGLPPDARYQGGRPRTCRFEGRPVSFDTVLEVVQGERGGLVIAPHAFSTKGIAEAARDAAEYRNEKLLAIEAPQFPLPEGRARDIWSGMPGWERRRRPAVVTSSDSKRLRPATPADTQYVGYRHTWIKMSRPSIESLRQAFLDPDDRLRFGQTRPEDEETHPRIRSVSVRGARFLADQEIELSGNLTTIIGGRGSGKSTVIEYVRQTLGQTAGIWGDEAQRNFARLQQTVTPETRVTVVIEKEGQSWTLESVGRAPATFIAGPSSPPDAARFFPARVLSQREIYALAEDRAARARLVDDLIRHELEALESDGRRVSLEARQLTAQLAELPQLAERERALATDEADLVARLERLAGLQGRLEEWKAFLSGQHWYEQVFTDVRAIVEQADLLRSALTDVELLVPPADVPATARLAGVRESLANAITGFRDALDAASAELANQVDTAAGRGSATWRAEFASAQIRYDALRDQLLDEGTDPDGYLDYGEQLQRVRTELAELSDRRAALGRTALERDELHRQLRDIWADESRARIGAAERLTNAVPKTADGDPFVRVTVDPYGDDRKFAELLTGVVQDHRRIATDYWGTFSDRAGEIIPADSLLASAFRSRAPGQSPVDLFLEWVRALRDGETPAGCPWAADDRKTSALLEWMSSAREAELRLVRVPDRTRVELRRPDGTVAGELEGGLSVGQRCTAVLALLLAADNVPIIIDQPEEDLDNEFVYRELVPLIRRVKRARQVIVSTHNANLPVNGDAELIVALRAVGGRGRLMSVAGEDAIGALDRRAACVAVEEVMEGSEEAFRRRSEMYGF